MGQRRGADPTSVDQAVGPVRRRRARYRRYAGARSDVERQVECRTKTGVFTGATATNPTTGEAVPVFVADYVLMGYGTGAIMAVPAHDSRDFEFARAFDLPVVPVVEPAASWLEGHGLGPDDVTDAAREWLADTGYDPAYGARPLRRLIQSAIGDPLARMLLAGQVVDGSTVRVDHAPDEVGGVEGLTLTVA